MDTTLKRKNIDLPVDTLKKLSLMAVAQGKSLKAYIEQVLISKANGITIEVSENPSPSGDKGIICRTEGAEGQWAYNRIHIPQTE